MAFLQLPRGEARLVVDDEIMVSGRKAGSSRTVVGDAAGLNLGRGPTFSWAGAIC